MFDKEKILHEYKWCDKNVESFLDLDCEDSEMISIYYMHIMGSVLYNYDNTIQLDDNEDFSRRIALLVSSAAIEEEVDITYENLKNLVADYKKVAISEELKQLFEKLTLCLLSLGDCRGIINYKGYRSDEGLQAVGAYNDLVKEKAIIEQSIRTFALKSDTCEARSNKNEAVINTELNDAITGVCDDLYNDETLEVDGDTILSVERNRFFEYAMFFCLKNAHKTDVETIDPIIEGRFIRLILDDDSRSAVYIKCKDFLEINKSIKNYRLSEKVFDLFQEYTQLHWSYERLKYGVHHRIEVEDGEFEKICYGLYHRIEIEYGYEITQRLCSISMALQEVKEKLYSYVE